MEQKQRGPSAIWLLAIFAALVASAQASAIQLNRGNYKGCVQQCSAHKQNALHLFSGHNSNLKQSIDGQSVQFDQDKTYSYRVQASTEVRTGYTGKDAQDSEEFQQSQQQTRDQLLAIEAVALFTPVSECEISMQLTQVAITQKKQTGQVFDQSDIIRELERPILFGYHNGAVSEVCLDQDQQQPFALDIKKSIISSLQTTPALSTITETVKVIEPDYSGECETEYAVEKHAWNRFTVNKRKNLAKCENPAEQESDLKRNWQSAVLKRSSANVAQCEQQIESRELKQVHCQSVRSVNTLMPHIQVQLISKVALQLQKTYPVAELSAQVPAQWTRHAHRLMMASPMFFGSQLLKGGNKNQINNQNQIVNENNFEPLIDGRVQLKSVLDQICADLKQNGERVSLKTAQYVHQLADAIRRSSAEDATFVWKNQVQTGVICEPALKKKIADIFVDTAASVMNVNGARIVRDQLVKHIESAKQQPEKSEQQLKELKRARALATLASFAYEPTVEAVQKIVPEIVEQVDDGHIILSLTALIKKVRPEIQEPQWLEQLYSTIVRKIQASYTEHDQEIETVRLLTALENIEPRTVVAEQSALIKLITDRRVFVSVRVAAIKSLVAIEMTAATRQALIQQVFATTTEHNELRIAAYQTVVKSAPEVPELRQILAIIESDAQNEDVRNYVCSHQKNLRTSEDGRKRSLLPLNAPLFPEPQSIANLFVSRAFEYATINPKTAVGAVVEADLIMEKDSRVPRSLTFNLTVPVAEQQVPIVEITIRQEGLEQSVIERLEKIKNFGKSPAVILRELRKMVQAIGESKSTEQSQHKQHQTGKLQVLINQDGKNLLVWDSVECQKDHSYDQFESVMEQLYRKLPIRIDQTTVVMPLKHRVRLPTASGIPVNFELNTTLIASLEATFTGAKSSPQSVLEMHIKPTLIAELGVGLEADLKFAGRRAQRVQFLNRFITAPTFHVRLTQRPETREYRVQIQTPEEEQIVGRFETQFNNEQDQEVMLSAIAEELDLKQEIRKAIRAHRSPVFYHQSARKHQEKCVPFIDSVIGITYCLREFSVDDLKHALNTKDAHKLIYLSQVKMVKTDRSMSAIEFGVQLPELFTAKQAKDELKFVFSYDTPNSQVNRRVHTELVLAVPQSKDDQFVAQIALDTPVKKFSGSVLVLNQQQKKALKIEFTADSRRQFLVEAEALVQLKPSDNNDNNKQVKLQLRIQPSPNAKITELEGEFAVTGVSESKRNVQLKLRANEQTIVEASLIKSGFLFKSNSDLKLSTTFALNLFGAKIESSALVNKNQATGTLKSTATLKYNRFFAWKRGSQATFETVSFQAQYTGLNQPWIQEQTPIKKFIHWTLESSQFPRLNQQLSYTIEGQLPLEFNQELTFKWAGESKKVHFVQQTKPLQNVRARALKYQTQAELEITPLNVHYETQLVVDFADKDQQQFPKNYEVEFRAKNVKTAKLAAEARVAFVVLAKKPLLQAELKSELKLNNGEQVFRYTEKVAETKPGQIEGKSVIELPNAKSVQKIQVNYLYKKLSSPVNRIPEFRTAFLQALIAAPLNSMEKFEHELLIESDRFGPIRHAGQIHLTEANQWQVNSQLERNQAQLYKTEAVYEPRERSLKIKFTTPKLDQLQLQITAQLKEDLKLAHVTVENRRMHHQTRVQLDRAQGDRFELSCTTKANAKTVFELVAKRQDKSAQLKIQNRWIEAEAELDNLTPRMIKSMLKKRSLEYQGGQSTESQIRVAFKLPTKDVEHKSELKIQPALKQMVITTDTRKRAQNLFKAQVELKPEAKNIFAEYRQGYTVQLRLSKDQTQESVYEFLADYQILPRQWSHKTQAKWHFTPAFKTIVSPVPKFWLISLDMKNHFGPEKVFDLVYRCNEQQRPQAEFAHEFTVSTKDTHAELQLSKFSLFKVAQQQQQSPKLRFTLKSKRFGGVDHKTELKQIDIDTRSVALYSHTNRQGETVVKVECALQLQRGAQSQIKIQLLNGHLIEAQFVPFQWLEAKADYGRQRWSHQIRVDRQQSQKAWSVKIVSVNKPDNEQWTGKLEHQCDQHTTFEVDTPVVRGNAEIRFENPQKNLKIHVDLKGDRQWKGVEQKATIQLIRDSKTAVIKTTTLYKSKPYLVIDAELTAYVARPSTIKIEIEPLAFKTYAQVLPKQFVEVKITKRDWTHEGQLKKRGNSEAVIQWDSRKEGQTVVSVDVQASPKKIQVKLESAIRRFAPVSVSANADIEDREVKVQAHNKRSDRLVKLDAKLKDLKNVHFELKWDAARDSTKQVLVQVRVQDKHQDPERFVASVVGDIASRPFEVKIDLGRTIRQLTKGAINQIEAEASNRATGEQYKAKIGRAVSQSGDHSCRSWVEIKKNDFTVVKAELKLNRAPERKHVQLKIESDVTAAQDLLNIDLDLTRECIISEKQCKTKAVAVYGTAEKKQIKFEGSNQPEAIRGLLVIDHPKSREQTIKFEYLKPEQKLQLNVFNQAGRQLDLNIDLARPLQKKFQIESFLASVPTVDIEWARGENSRFVVLVSFQEEKKAELSLNWFGQWRRDFKLEALFKCFSKPQIEMLITSRHPASVDEIDAMIKIDSKQYALKWVRKFDPTKPQNWTTKSVVQVNGEKKVDLEIEAVTVELDSNREQKIIKAQLQGVKQATAQLKLVTRRSVVSPLEKIESIQAELGNKHHDQLVNFELHFGARTHQQVLTGVKLAAKDRTIFGLTHLTSDRAQQKRTSMIRLELPDQIEYVLRNEIEYHHRRPEQIRSIRSELKRKQGSVQPIYQTRVTFGEDRVQDLKVMRVEIYSDRFNEVNAINNAKFNSQNQINNQIFKAVPKVIEFRYNFEPKQCQTLEAHQHQTRTLAFGDRIKCWRMHLLAGESKRSPAAIAQESSTQDFELQPEHEFDLKIAAEYVKYPIDGRHSNRTVRFVIQAKPEQQQFLNNQIQNINQEQSYITAGTPINFTWTGHASAHSIGVQWDNHNRHGQLKSGMIHLEKQPLESGKSLVNLYVRKQNRRQPAKNIEYELHFIPQQLRKSLRMSAKYDQESVRRWIVGELPRLEELARDRSNMRERMMAELRDEIRHKLQYLKDNYHQELIRPMVEEAREVQRQLKRSEDRIAKEIVRVSKRAAEKIAEVADQIDFEHSVAELVQLWDEAVEQWTEGVKDYLMTACRQNRACAKAVDQIRDYEIEQFVEKNVVKRMRAVADKVKRAMPEEVVRSMKQMAKELAKVHRGEDEDDEQEWNSEEVDEDNFAKKEQMKMKKERTSARWMRPAARLLKMSQPEMSEIVFTHMAKMSKKFDSDDWENENQKKNKFSAADSKKVNWPELRGSMHDMAMDVIEEMNQKAQKKQDQEEQESKPFWSKFMGGSNGNNNAQGSQGGYGNYAAMGQKYQNQWSAKNNKSAKESMMAESNKSNLIFSPKRGEFKFGFNKNYNNNEDSTTEAWTRS